MDERRVASSTIEVPSCEAVESQKSTQVPVVPLCRACIVGKEQRSSITFSPWWCSVGLCNNADRVAGEILSPRLKDNKHTIDPSDSNTMSNLGLASILTERSEGTRRLDRIP